MKKKNNTRQSQSEKKLKEIIMKENDMIKKILKRNFKKKQQKIEIRKLITNLGEKLS